MRRKNCVRVLALLLVLCVALSACGGGNVAAAQSPGTASVPGQSTEGGYTAPALELSDYNPNAAEGENGVLFDTSGLSKGYIAVSAQSEARLKFKVAQGENKYYYDLPGDGTPQSFVLQCGDGEYTFAVMQNTEADKYAELYSVTQQVTLESEQAPFLRPSQNVNYNADSRCVAKAEELARTAATPADVVAVVYAYIRDNIAYDEEKAVSVQDGYLPDPDTTLAEGRGICYDYASLAAAMLRSQGIPAKVVTGYVSPNDFYHAWNMVWLEESGWITVKIQAPSKAWMRIDLTLAAGADAAWTGDGNAYTDRYYY